MASSPSLSSSGIWESSADSDTTDDTSESDTISSDELEGINDVDEGLTYSETLQADMTSCVQRKAGWLDICLLCTVHCVVHCKFSRILYYILSLSLSLLRIYIACFDRIFFSMLRIGVQNEFAAGAFFAGWVVQMAFPQCRPFTTWFRQQWAIQAELCEDCSHTDQNAWSLQWYGDCINDTTYAASTIGECLCLCLLRINGQLVQHIIHEKNTIQLQWHWQWLLCFCQFVSSSHFECVVVVVFFFGMISFMSQLATLRSFGKGCRQWLHT